MMMLSKIVDHLEKEFENLNPMALYLDFEIIIYGCFSLLISFKKLFTFTILGFSAVGSRFVASSHFLV